MFFIPVPHMFIIKNEHVASRFYKTDMDSLVSISLYFFERIWRLIDQLLGAINETASVP